jgi:predicted component of type VI protein secretion system
MFTANVLAGLPGASPTGIVMFAEGSTRLATAPVDASVPGAAVAKYETARLPVGDHEIVATYLGNDAINPSASPPISQVVQEPAIPLEPPPPPAPPAPPAPPTTAGSNTGASGSAATSGGSARGTSSDGRVLAFTGSTLAWLAIGSILLAVGLLLTLATRRRQSASS